MIRLLLVDGEPEFMAMVDHDRDVEVIRVRSGMEVYSFLQTQDPVDGVLLATFPLVDVSVEQGPRFFGLCRSLRPNTTMVVRSGVPLATHDVIVETMGTPWMAIKERFVQIPMAKAPWESTEKDSPLPWGENPFAAPFDAPFGKEEPSFSKPSPAFSPPSAPSVGDPETSMFRRVALNKEEEESFSYFRKPPVMQEEPNFVPPTASFRQMVLCVHAAKGGVGKTTIVKEMGVLFSRVRMGGQPLRVLIVDLDVNYGDMAVTFQIHNAPTNIFVWKKAIEANQGAIRSEDILKYVVDAPGRSNLKLLLAPSRAIDGMGLSADMVKKMIQALVASKQFDVILLDTANDTDPMSLMAMSMADHILYLVTQSFTSIDDAYKELKDLRQVFSADPRLGLQMDRFRLLVNMVREGNKFMEPRSIADGLKLPLLGIMPDCGAEVEMKNNAGNAFCDDASHRYTQAMTTMLQGISPIFQADPRKKKASEPSKKGRSFFGRGKK